MKVQWRKVFGLSCGNQVQSYEKEFKHFSQDVWVNFEYLDEDLTLLGFDVVEVDSRFVPSKEEYEQKVEAYREEIFQFRRTLDCHAELNDEQLRLFIRENT